MPKRLRVDEVKLSRPCVDRAGLVPPLCNKPMRDWPVRLLGRRTPFSAAGFVLEEQGLAQDGRDRGGLIGLCD
jgi:hypothetical protein